MHNILLGNTTSIRVAKEFPRERISSLEGDSVGVCSGSATLGIGIATSIGSTLLGNATSLLLVSIHTIAVIRIWHWSDTSLGSVLVFHHLKLLLGEGVLGRTSAHTTTRSTWDPLSNSQSLLRLRVGIACSSASHHHHGLTIRRNTTHLEIIFDAWASAVASLLSNLPLLLRVSILLLVSSRKLLRALRLLQYIWKKPL